jgi:pimeloyl-ACP methyl ester carboxylesterase
VTLLGEGAQLVGHSYGGLIAMCAAASRPDLVKSLTIVEAPAWAVARLVERMMPGWRSPTPPGWRGPAPSLTPDAGSLLQAGPSSCSVSGR